MRDLKAEKCLKSDLQRIDEYETELVCEKTKDPDDDSDCCIVEPIQEAVSKKPRKEPQD